jgi:hypothetical protein
MGKGLRNLVVAGSLAALTLALSATIASAGILVKSAPDCSPKPASQVFARWGDSSQYNLAPGGSFEAGAAAWSLSSRASVVSGNEPWKVAGAGHTRSLKLPPGASATSPTICVGLEHPTIRFFAKNNSALLSTLSVEVITETSLGLTVPVPVGVMLPSGQWKPSPKFLVVANLLPLLPGEHTPVRFRVTSIGTGTWSVDDFYVDPRCH